jgi:hypothetical protein
MPFDPDFDDVYSGLIDIATTMESSRSELTRTRNLLEERIQRFEAA